MFGKLASWIMGGSVDNIVDKASAGIDALVFTDQEKAGMKTKMNEKVLDFRLKYAEITANQSPARRMIALIVTAMWVALIVTGVLAKGFGAEEFATYCFATLNDNVNYSFLAVIAFYFSAHLLKAGK